MSSLRRSAFIAYNHHIRSSSIRKHRIVKDAEGKPVPPLAKAVAAGGPAERGPCPLRHRPSSRLHLGNPGRPNKPAGRSSRSGFGGRLSL